MKSVKNVWPEIWIGILITALGLPLALIVDIRAVWLRILLCVGIAFVALVLTIWWHARRGRRGAIQVFLPKWDDPKFKGDFYQDGSVQYAGFMQAERDGEKIYPKLNVKYQPMYENSTAEEILDLMEKLYEEGSTYFVMTMSSKVGVILDGFRQWHKQIVSTGVNKDKRKTIAPILIVTVASAPELADAENGIVRWYIRSEEESRILADHLRRNLEFQRAAAFGVEHRPGMRDSAYGEQGIKLFIKEFKRLGGDVPQDLEFYVTAETAKIHVKTFFDKYNSSNWPGVFVVGYGDMVKNTLTELIAGGYEGSIVCTSTLTDRQWQPSEEVLKTHNKVKVFTVLPRLKDGSDHLSGNDRNVVFFFARKTLLRVLKLTTGKTNSQKFLESWGKEEKTEMLVQEYLTCGDIRVELDFVGVEKVR